MNTPLPLPSLLPQLPPPPQLVPSQAYFPKCCGCLHLRLGSILCCLVWATLSMYFAVISFNNQSIFFSYLTRTKAPTIVFGVINLIFSLVAAFGIIILVFDIREKVITLSHSVWVCVGLVLISLFANIVVFIRDPDDYIVTQCVIDAGNSLNQALSKVTNATLNSPDDFYHCSRLREDEMKFGIVFFILMFSFYIYWAICLYRYRHALAEIGDPMGLNIFKDPYGVQPPMMDPVMGVPPPPQSFSHPNFPIDDRPTIILTNQRPS